MTKAFSTKPWCKIHKHTINCGIAAAILTGMRAAKHEVVCSMDSDCTYDPLKLKEMIPLLTTGVDLVTASPYHPQGQVLNVPSWRLSLSKGCAWLYRRLLTNKLYTYTSCFRVYRKSSILQLPLKHMRYLGIAELVGLCDIHGMKVVECPAVLESRIIGQSKMKVANTIVGHLKLMFQLAWGKLRKNQQPDRDLVIRSQLARQLVITKEQQLLSAQFRAMPSEPSEPTAPMETPPPHSPRSSTFSAVQSSRETVPPLFEK
jgi:hypothetical protein